MADAGDSFVKRRRVFLGTGDDGKPIPPPPLNHGPDLPTFVHLELIVLQQHPFTSAKVPCSVQT